MNMTIKCFYKRLQGLMDEQYMKIRNEVIKELFLLSWCNWKVVVFLEFCFAKCGFFVWQHWHEMLSFLLMCKQSPKKMWFIWIWLLLGVGDFVAIKKEKKEDDNENDDKGKMWESFIIAKN